MIIELKEYELPKGKRLHESESYTEAGIFIVNDGVAIHIVSIPKVGEPPFMMPIPLESLTQYISHKSAKETEKDISARLQKMLEDVSSKVDELLEQKQIESIPQIYTEEKIGGTTLLKAIALAQNPELAKDLIREE